MAALLRYTAALSTPPTRGLGFPLIIKIRKSAIKFIEKLDPNTLSQIQEQLQQLLKAVEEQNVIPFTDFDIKQMKGA